jgi:hypothetical protein
MPISAGTNIILRGGQDPDALAYFARAGIDSGTQTPSSYDNAASFTSASSQSLTSTAANLQCQSQSFTVAGWFFMPSNAAAYAPLMSQGGAENTANGGWSFLKYDTQQRLYFSLRNDNAGTAINTISEIFTPDQWNFVEAGFDSALSQVFISINGGTRNFSTATAGWTFPNTGVIATRFGRLASSLWFGGNLAGWGLWKRALTASEVTQLWNNGAGRTYASLDSGLRTNLVSWWALNQNSVTADSHTTGNNLTNNGTPLVTATTLGPIVTTTQNSRQLINNFVKGIKSLGLWNSMVCWPLRSSQNAGSGLTARSLGGLGNFDGTLAGGTLPSWTANGLSLAASSQMNASVTTVPENVTLLFAAAGNGTQTAFAQYFGLQNASAWSANEARIQDGQNNNGLTTNQRNSVINTNSGAISPNPFNSQNFSFVSGSLNQAGSLLNVRNLNTGATSSATPGTTGTNTLNRVQLNGRWDGSLALGTPHTAAFCGYITPASDGQVSAIYSLYRNTLGIGLNLP